MNDSLNSIEANFPGSTHSFDSSDPPQVDQASLKAAQVLLAEAVFQSRAKQASAAGLARTDLTGEVGPGSCGLGSRALVELSQSENGQAAFATLFPNHDSQADDSALAALLTAWVERQDGLDRKRNHFLRDFRDQHGYDRRTYDASQQAQFEAGIEKVNGEENKRRLEAAVALVALSLSKKNS